MPEQFAPFENMESGRDLTPQSEPSLIQPHAEKVFHGYKIVVNSLEDAEKIVRDFWTESHPDTIEYFESGMWDTTKNDELTHHSDRTNIIRVSPKSESDSEQFIVLIAGNGQPLKPESEGWLANNGYIN